MQNDGGLNSIRRKIFFSLTILLLTVSPAMNVSAAEPAGRVFLQIDGKEFHEETDSLIVRMTVTNGSSMVIPVCELTLDAGNTGENEGLTFSMVPDRITAGDGSVPENFTESEEGTSAVLSWNNMKPGEAFSFVADYLVDRPETDEEVQLSKHMTARIHIYDPAIPAFNSATNLDVLFSISSAVRETAPAASASPATTALPEAAAQQETKPVATESEPETEPTRIPEKKLSEADRGSTGGVEGGAAVKTVFEADTLSASKEQIPLSFLNLRTKKKTGQGNFMAYLLRAAVCAGAVFLSLLVVYRIRLAGEERKRKFDPDRKSR